MAQILFSLITEHFGFNKKYLEQTRFILLNKLSTICIFSRAKVFKFYYIKCPIIFERLTEQNKNAYKQIWMIWNRRIEQIEH